MNGDAPSFEQRSTMNGAVGRRVREPMFAERSTMNDDAPIAEQLPNMNNVVGSCNIGGVNDMDESKLSWCLQISAAFVVYRIRLLQGVM